MIIEIDFVRVMINVYWMLWFVAILATMSDDERWESAGIFGVAFLAGTAIGFAVQKLVFS